MSTINNNKLNFAYIEGESIELIDESKTHEIYFYEEVEATVDDKKGFYAFWMPSAVKVVSIKKMGTAIGTTPMFYNKLVSIYAIELAYGKEIYCEASPLFRVLTRKETLYMSSSR